MSSERLSLTVGPTDGKQKSVSVNNGVEGNDDGNRPPRLPRWTRHEILVLIQGKKVAENRVRRGRTGASSAFGSNPLEPKWASVSSYCKRHGVNRGPVQCRKRWSNLAGDFKKIKEWETQISEESESFWVMRNDLRRERKLPGFFDREVYDILDGGVVAPLTVTTDGKVDDEVTLTVTVEKEEEVATVDSGRTAAANDGLCLNIEQSGQDERETVDNKEGSSKMVSSPPVPISEKSYQVIYKGSSNQGTTNESQQQTSKLEEKPAFIRSTEEGSKRRRRSSSSPDGGGGGGGSGGGGGGEEEVQYVNIQEQLIKVLERNNRILTAQIEAHNVNSQLDREQRINHTNSLVAVFSKLADSIAKIADKL